MSLFLSILFQITLPIVVIAGLGFVLQRWLKFDVATLNRFVVYVILPSFLTYYLSSATIPLSAVAQYGASVAVPVDTRGLLAALAMLLGFAAMRRLRPRRR